MDSIYSIVHITTEENYKKIMEDGYLRPYHSVHGTGVFCFIQKKKDQWKNTVLRLSGTYVIQLDKKILLERSDYIIRNSMMDGWEAFGGPVIYNAKEDKDRKQLNKAIRKLTNLNEIMFGNKISLKKYMMSSFTKKIQSGGVWGENEDSILFKCQKFIVTKIGIVRYEYPSIGISSNAKIFMGVLEKKQNEIIEIAVKLQQNNLNAQNEAMISMELSGLPGIPKYFTYGLYGPKPKLNYIIMDRLGPTFGSSEKITVGSTFELHKLKMLFNNYSIQLINGIETLYRHNYYHVDITTSNILFGIGDYQDFLYLIDFCNIAETKVEYESDIHNFNKNCNNSLYNAISDIIINYALHQYAKFFKYSIFVITSTIEFIIKSIILTDTTEPPKFQALRDMLSNLAKDIILPLQADNNILRFAIEKRVVRDEIIPFLLEEAKNKSSNV